MTVAAAPAPQHTPQSLSRAHALEPGVYDGLLPELGPEIIEIILRRMGLERKSLPSLNRGGWKSSESFFQWGDPAVQQLRAAIADFCGRAPIGWAMVNGPGATHPRHQHRIAILSGVYYLDSSDTPTILECADKTEIEVLPAPGRIVVFPGTTWHRVPPVTDAQRVTIAFDVRR